MANCKYYNNKCAISPIILLIIHYKLIVDVRLYGTKSLIQQQGQVSLKDMEKAIQELPLP